ncbi:MAG: type VI secretion system tip protein TssI/VgrG [Myxococcota bacterium]
MADASLPPVDYTLICDDGPSAGSWSVYRFYLEEAISRPYDCTVEIVTDDLNADTNGFLGQSASVEWGRPDGDIHAVHGIVVEVDFIGRTEDQLMVRLRLAPAFALARQNTQHRIYQEMSVLEIVKDVLGFLDAYGRSLDEGSGTRGTAVRDYCVQYGESDFDFVSRLLEEEGISYVFNHDGAAEQMLLTYENSDYAEALNRDGSPVFPLVVDRPGLIEVLSVQAFEQKLALMPTDTLRQDYDFLAPTKPLTAVESSPLDEAGYVRRLYGAMDRRFVADDVGDRALDLLEAAQMRGNTVRGQGLAESMRAGLTFELDRHHKEDLENQFVLTRVVHTGLCPEVIVQGASGGGDESRYRNRFEVVPLEQPVRPLQRAPKPRVRGPQTAIVCGPAGEEIHTDEHGRIKVQFHWEEEPKADDTSSCWVRVAQSWAGPGWGAQFIPRIGMEVVVNFLEGNPDRPLVTGCVYNGDNAPPFAVPDSKTQSGFKSSSSPGGDGYNQFQFEDAAGGEQINLHAQKDWNNTVLNDRTTTIGNDDTLAITANRTKTVDKDQSETVGGNKSISVTGNHSETVSGTQDVTVTKDASFTCQANQSITVMQNVTETINGKHEQTIAQTSKVNVLLKADEVVGAAKSVTVGGMYSEKVGASRSITAVGAFSVTAGLSGKFQCAKDITIAAQKKMTIEAGDAMDITATKKTSIIAKDDYVLKGDKKLTFDVKTEIAFKCGKASISLKKSGDVMIKGNKIQVKGSGDVIVKGANVKVN